MLVGQPVYRLECKKKKKIVIFFLSAVFFSQKLATTTTTTKIESLPALSLADTNFSELSVFSLQYSDMIEKDSAECSFSELSILRRSLLPAIR